LNLGANLNTTAGATYEISFTLQDASFSGNFGGAGDLWFGNCKNSLDDAFDDGYMGHGGYVFPSVNYDFTAVAASSTTSISFDFVLDEGLNANLSNLMITEVPEISSNRLLCCGGCMFLLARQLRRLSQKRVPAVKPTA
jgi:hypothetical protein